MPLGYWVSVTMHVLAALLWLGGMFFLALVGAPALRTLDPALRQRLFRDLGSRFRKVGWVSLAVLIVTGMLNLYYRGWLHWEGALGDATFWRTATGAALAWKLGAVAAMLVVQGIHDFALGPASSRAIAGSTEALLLRRRAALLARASALLGLVIVIAAVRLARGG
jgi:copper resistance protein D